MDRDGWMGVGLLALGGWLYYAVAAIPANPLVPIGPGFYPRIVLLLMIVLSLALVVQNLRTHRALKEKKKETGSSQGRLKKYRPTLITFALFGLYVVLLPKLGFLVCTALFVASLQWLLGPSLLRRLPASLLLGIGTSVVTYFVFEKYLYVLFPRGAWIP